MKRLIVFGFALMLLIGTFGIVLAQERGNGSGDDDREEMRDEIREEVRNEMRNGSGDDDREEMRDEIREEVRNEIKERFDDFKERLRRGENEFHIKGENITISELSDEKKEIVAGKINAKTGLNLTADDIDDGSAGQILRAYLSNGRWAEVKVMPNVAALVAMEKLKAKCDERNCSVELKEVGSGNKTRLAYEIETEKNATFLFFFKKKMLVKAEVDAETGEIIGMHKPWWRFMAREKHEVENEDDKVTVCHKPGNESVIITVSNNALQAHLAHGDSLDLAACGNKTAEDDDDQQNETEIELNDTDDDLDLNESDDDDDQQNETEIELNDTDDDLDLNESENDLNESEND